MAHEPLGDAAEHRGGHRGVAARPGDDDGGIAIRRTVGERAPEAETRLAAAREEREERRLATGAHADLDRRAVERRAGDVGGRCLVVPGWRERLVARRDMLQNLQA